MRTAQAIRDDFIDFFREHGHTFAASSPVVPHDDPTLLFTNAGMNQFKDVFLGQGQREYTRAANTQKCIRAGGKHNDLEDVGADTYHHTFFEMLGNWSFGDYFKAEAIAWAWELLVDRWGLDPNRLYATVFEGNDEDGIPADEEAEQLWRQRLPAARVSRWGKKDNFWEMGDTGPCGPCSELHYDGRTDEERAKLDGAALVNRGHPDVIEIWNLVFIQFNRDAHGKLTPLPARHVDTGMGLERVVRVLQGKSSNYDTDLWSGIFEAIRVRTGVRPYGGELLDSIDTAYRVIADHARCLAVALADGARPGSDGRGYVLRRILRRALRVAHQALGAREPIVCDIIPAVVRSLGGAFPTLLEHEDAVRATVREEEVAFLRTLERGLELFDEAAQRSEDGCVSAEDAFKLHDTFGFPIDLTRVMARERNLSVDETGYERLMAEARETSRRGGGGEEKRDLGLPPAAIGTLERLRTAPTRDASKYAPHPVNAKVEAIWNGTDFDAVAHHGGEVAVILNRTNHYAESGGQVGDHGRLRIDTMDFGTSGRDTAGFVTGPSAEGDCRFEVTETIASGGWVLHVGHVREGRLRVGDSVEVIVDIERRRQTAANHTGTHLLNHALREVLGDGVEQRGSLVAPDRLRFDFSAGAMTIEQITEVERLVNDAIGRDLTVHAETVPLAEAQRIHGVRAVFGERYPDPVRVVSVGPSVADLCANPDNPAWRGASVEFCGGTHLDSTKTARHLVILREEALAAGVRRITALTGPAAQAAEMAGEAIGGQLQAALKAEGAELIEQLESINAEIEGIGLGAVARARLEPDLERLRALVRAERKAGQASARAGVVDQARAIADESADAAVIVRELEGADKDTLLSAIDVIRDRCPEAAALLLAPDEEAGKVAIVASVPKPAIGRGLKAGDWVRAAAQACGGGGGGRPDMAMAGGKDPKRVREAVDAARTFAEQALGAPK